MSLPLLVVLGVFVAVAGIAAFWQLGMKERSATDAATRFAAALVADDPGAAPAGGGDYVTGVRAYFGPVRTARVIGAHNETVRDRFPGADDRGRTHTFAVAQLLLRTERGPAVLELEFDDGSLLGGRAISGVRELEPYEVSGLARNGGLTAAFDARGGRPVGQIALSRVG